MDRDLPEYSIRLKVNGLKMNQRMHRNLHFWLLFLALLWIPSGATSLKLAPACKSDTFCRLDAADGVKSNVGRSVVWLI